MGCHHYETTVFVLCAQSLLHVCMIVLKANAILVLHFLRIIIIRLMKVVTVKMVILLYFKRMKNKGLFILSTVSSPHHLVQQTSPCIQVIIKDPVLHSLTLHCTFY